jgi:hypothetical protein
MHEFITSLQFANSQENQAMEDALVANWSPAP